MSTTDDNTSIVFNRLSYARIIAAAAGTRGFDDDASMARITSEGKLLGGVLYTDFTGIGGSIHMHCAGFVPRWLNRDLLWAAFHYPFEQLCVIKVFLQIKPSNLPSLRFANNLGFALEHVIKDTHRDSDTLLLSLYRRDCRFLALSPRSLRDMNDGQEGT